MGTKPKEHVISKEKPQHITELLQRGESGYYPLSDISRKLCFHYSQITTKL